MMLATPRKRFGTLGRTVLFAAGLGVMFGLISCNKLKHSPWQTDLPSHMKQLTAQNLKLLEEQTPKDVRSFRVAILGDPQGTPGEFRNVVDRINQIPEIAFLLVLGDLTDYGLKQEYEWAYEALSRSKVPYFTAVGNHDAISHGKTLYQDMFGEFNYSFRYGGLKFVMWNNNKNEFSTSNFDWLAKQMDRNTVVASHIPPEVDVHTQAEVDRWYAMNAKAGIVTSMHGHRGTKDSFYWKRDQIPYFVVAKVHGGHYAVANFKKNAEGGFDVKYEHCKGAVCEVVGE